MSIQDIYNSLKVNDQVTTSGQPTITQLESAAKEGIATVINLGLLDQSYSLEDEAGLVRALGMNYYHIPVVWDHPTEEDYEKFEDLINHLPAGKLLIHCAANFRATAFYALYGLRNLDWTESRVKELMSPIWSGSHYPVWQKFIQRLKSQPGPSK